MKIKVNPIDPDSIDKAIAAIETYEKSIDEKVKRIIETLTEMGVTHARDLVPVDTGVAQASITGYLDEDSGKGIILAGGYCKFIEFGTGVRGLNDKHPSDEYRAAVAWAYNVGATIFTTKDGRQGWYYPADDGTWKFTQGMPSRPFMYHTAEYLRRELQRVVSEVFASGS